MGLKIIQVFYRVKRILKPKIQNIKIVEAINLQKMSYQWTDVRLRDKSFFNLKNSYIKSMGQDNQDSWTDPNQSHLWQYNQNYFDDLNSVLVKVI